MPSSDLLTRLGSPEDNFTERKPESANAREFRTTLVAFANSVPLDRDALLFIGVMDDGAVLGVRSPDQLQKTTYKIAAEECYPPIPHTAETFSAQGKVVLAIRIRASDQRPHFAGAAFVRTGSQNVRASKEVYEGLIASRNTKAAAILRQKGSVVTVSVPNLLAGRFMKMSGQASRSVPRSVYEARIEGCDAFVVHLCSLSSQRRISYPLEKVTIGYDTAHQRTMLALM